MWSTATKSWAKDGVPFAKRCRSMLRPRTRRLSNCMRVGASYARFRRVSPACAKEPRRSGVIREHWAGPPVRRDGYYTRWAAAAAAVS